MTNENRFDILISLDLPPGIDFTGASSRNASYNNEKALMVLDWQASFGDFVGEKVEGLFFSWSQL